MKENNKSSVKKKIKKKKPLEPNRGTFFHTDRSDRSGDLAGTKAARADVDGLVRAVLHDADTADVGLPAAVGLAVGVGDVVTEGNALSADCTLCHVGHLQNRFDIGFLPTIADFYR